MFLQIESFLKDKGSIKLSSLKELIDIFTETNDHETMNRLFNEMFTKKEIKDLTLRWQLLKDLHKGDTQRSIASRHKISLCKITRGSKLLKDPDSFIGSVLKKLYSNS